MTTNLEPRPKRLSIPFYLMLAVRRFVFVQTFSTLSPIYLSFLLTLIISLTLNPLVSKLRRLGVLVAAPMVAVVTILHEEH